MTPHMHNIAFNIFMASIGFFFLSGCVMVSLNPHKRKHEKVADVCFSLMFLLQPITIVSFILL